MQLSFIFFTRPALFISLLCSLSVIPALSHPQAPPTHDEPKLPLPVEIIYEFQPGTSLENIVVRRNGQILTTVLTAPKIYQVDPCKKKEPILLYTFPASFVTGIAELEPDVFYVAAGNTSVSNTFESIPGSFAIWKLDLRHFSISSDKSKVEVTKIVTVPKAQILNGIAVLNQRKGLILVADTLLGLIWRVNVYTKEIKFFTEDPLTKAPSNAPIPFGVNGIKIYRGAVYFTNSLKNIIGRIDYNRRDGTAKGPAVVVVKGLNGPDDFTIGPNGAFFTAEATGSALAYAPPGGGDAKVIANITANPTAVAFGRRREDSQSVYLSSTGATLQEFASRTPTRGRVLKVNVGAFLNGSGQ